MRMERPSEPQCPSAPLSLSMSERLMRLRLRMKENSIDIYIILHEDSHHSEIIAPCDARQEFISGFTGSAGCAVITHDKAALETDGRYFNQASTQLTDNWILLRKGLNNVPTWQEWTAQQAQGGEMVGVDSTTITAEDARKLAADIKSQGGGDLVAVEENLADSVWGEARPPRPSEPVQVHPLKYAGRDLRTKLQNVRDDLELRKSSGMVVSMLDEVSWLFNLRGSDIPYTPVFFSYAVITQTTAILYVDSTKLSNDCQTHLEENGVQIRQYEMIFEDTGKLCGESQMSKKNFTVSAKASWALVRCLEHNFKVEIVRSPIELVKALKNPAELDGMRACHIRDGAAVIEFLAWLEDALHSEVADIDEVAAADKLEQLRSKQENFVSLSFDTISATGANAAIIHYSPERDNCSIIDPEKIYLCDSGAQYVDGTTDITRTLHFGQPTEFERRAYTLVLKGHIALDVATYPQGTNGYQLDSLARQFLWAEGLTYAHGTGHGVGSYLNVHEGPIGIGANIQFSEVALSPGNVISNEPGYYEDGGFGIRIENLVLVKESEIKCQFSEKPFLEFEHVTMVPYCRKLICEEMLTAGEIRWLSEYNMEVSQVMEGCFEIGSLAGRWLERETRPFTKV